MTFSPFIGNQLGEEGVATVKSTMEALEKIDQLGSLRYDMVFFSMEGNSHSSSNFIRHKNAFK